MRSKVKPQTLEEHIASQEQLLHLSCINLYFAEFYNKLTGRLDFRKFGVTGKPTSIERFYNKYEKEQYEDWDIKIVCEVKLQPKTALTKEYYLQKRFPKNLIIEKKIKGVTEIFTGYNKYVPDIIKYFEYLKTKFGV
jgi:hypothetical protein